MGGFWYAIGRTPTEAEIDRFARSVSVVVLNAWELGVAAELRKRNPAIKILVYKDLSSTRSYSGAVVGGRDADLLPAGVGYRSARPSWFATDQFNRRIEWRYFPDHWQMAVWDKGYRDEWVRSVVDEVVGNGWDGVLADNDLTTLSVYSPMLLSGTSTQAETDAKLRQGLDALIDEAGARLQQVGKSLVPNIADARIGNSRWERQSRFGGGMAEFFASAYGSVSVLGDLREAPEPSPAAGRMRLLITQATTDAERETGFAAASLYASPGTSWMSARKGNYSGGPDILLLGSGLGTPTSPSTREPGGWWHRAFTGGEVAVNPSDRPVQIAVPDGARRPDGTTVTDGRLPARTGWVLLDG